MKKARLIAFYLPQFHSIPENDQWWGNGFTEWTNVKKARPLFQNHYQPCIPTELGYYNLGYPEIRQAQAELAQQYGIEGFCYWHYWFSGRRLLEKPFLEVLKSGKPNFPFCLGWANASWSGIWYGAPGKILIKQEYPGMKDIKTHFYQLIEAFHDLRYITVDGKPLFYIYQPNLIPKPREFIDCWNNLAIKEGLRGIYFVGNSENLDWNPENFGFNAKTFDNPKLTLYIALELLQSFNFRINCKLLTSLGKSIKDIFSFFSKPYIFDYKDYVLMSLPKQFTRTNEFPCIVPNWDHTTRCGVNGTVLHNSTPELFRLHLKEAINIIRDREFDKRIIFLKSWNEWGEGNYMEPDEKFGRAYLEVCQSEIINDRN